MRGLIAAFSAIALAVSLLFWNLSPSFVFSFEEKASLTMGVFSERKYSPLDEGSNDRTNETAENEKEAREESAVGQAPEKQERKASVFYHDGAAEYTFLEPMSELFVSNLENKLSDCLHYDGVPDYKSFAFQGRMTPLASPLTDEEVAYVFARIVSSRTSAVPIRCHMEEITFEKSGELLTARAKITVDFRELSNQYKLGFLPNRTAFSLYVPFKVINSEISACLEEVEVRSESFSLPKALLIFGCNVAFGKKDYQSLFGEALENVFVNAGIYR